jgi:hypothetical protein
MRSYLDLGTIYQDESFGDYLIFNNQNKSIASKKIKSFYNVTTEYEGFSDIYLTKNNEIVMNTTEFELLTNKEFLEKSNGDILIIGLGLGMVVYPLLNDPNVTSIKIIENDPTLIQYIGNKISNYDNLNKVTIISGDAYTYHNVMDINEKYDTIFLDFWTQLNKENVEEVTTIKENYRPFLKDQNSILLSWCEDIKHILIESFSQ